MSLSAVCIRRPVFTTMLTALPIVLGIVSYRRLGVELQPKLDLPFVFVTTALRGASVEEMETQVTRPIEEAVNTIDGIDELRSVTSEGVSRVFIRFAMEKSPDIALQEVQNKVNAMVSQLPIGSTQPVMDKVDEDAAPVITLVVSGERDLREVTEIARRQIKENIETVSGVGQVALVGGRRRTIEVELDTDRLRNFNLSVEDVRQALMAQNLELPGGRVDQQSRELVLRVLGRFSDAEHFNGLILAKRGDYTVRVGDVGRAREAVEDPRSLAKLDGIPAVSLIVRKQTGANTVEVVNNVKKKLEILRPALPPDLKVEAVRDQARFIEGSIEEVKFHLLLAAGLVSITILGFINDWRTTLIATSAIPASIIATFACMDALGFTVNNITMLALVLAIGIVIDDAVVVHENIFRHMEEHGRNAMEASRIGTAEIALAVMATSLSLMVIFVPVAFMQGQVGRLFNSFGLTIAFAILMSLFVSFTLTPMLCSRFLKVEPGHGGSKSNFVYRAVENSYAAILGWSIRHKWIVAGLSALLIATGYPLLLATPMEYIPRDDTSEFELTATGPAGINLDEMEERFAEFEAKFRTLPGVTHILTTIGDTSGRVTRGAGDVTRGTLYVKLVDLRDRNFTQFDVMSKARELVKPYTDWRTSISDVDPLRSGGNNFAVDVNLVGTDMDVLGDYTHQLVDRLKTVPGLTDADTTLSVRKPEIHVALDRERAADLGVTAEAVASSLAVLVGGEPVSTFKDNDEQYDVWLRAMPGQRVDSRAILDMTLPTNTGQLVPLGSIARLEETRGPSQIERLNRMRRTTVGVNLDGIATGEAVAKVMKEANALDMPPAYGVRKGYRSRSLDEVATNFALAFVLSLAFMYMVLAAQFESFTDPVTILLALPLTFPFALLSLKMLHQPMDIYAIFGLFMLVGIVKKNGILQVDYTNELRRRGVPRDEAILQANRTRLRPILMTTLMLVAGMVPLALGRGPGAAARASLAKVIIGGQMLSLLPTLLITPVAYAILDGVSSRLRIRRRPSPPLPDPEERVAEVIAETQLVGSG